ncbi:MAG: DUF2798 domain-containing protein [Rhodocyclaceae bacterium]|nr:MAG: DUF2798 domain-containing protein [Rhodocyclaceae bacterium]
MIPKKYGPVLFSLILSGMMSLLVSGIATLRAAGLAEGVLTIWMSAWITAWLIAFPAVMLAAPLTQKIVGGLITKA